MISRYKDNMQRYNNILDYINNYQDISEELRKELINLIQKFKVLISCMEEKELYDLINSSIKVGNTQSLKKELDIMAFGRRRDYDKTFKYRNAEKDEKYNLD